jgi:hypothetical protein
VKALADEISLVPGHNLQRLLKIHIRFTLLSVLGLDDSPQCRWEVKERKRWLEVLSILSTKCRFNLVFIKITLFCKALGFRQDFTNIDDAICQYGLEKCCDFVASSLG